jgi:two-component system, sensor histidine kinase and response regulator
MEEKRDILVKPYKILIVDDDPLIVQTLERLLFKKHFLFHSVNTGEKALEAVTNLNPDIVLLDVMMMQMDGYQVCRSLKNSPHYKNLPVIFLTSNTTIEDIIKGFRAGAVDYITKPFNPEELIARLETHLELKRSREEIKHMDMIKTKFFSIMSNDIKDALIGLRGVASFLHQELSETNTATSEPLKMSRLLLNDSNELYNLLENLIEWATIELGKKQIIPVKVNIYDFISESVNEFENAIIQKNLTINITADHNSETFLASDQMNSIFQRLLSNAIKYSYRDGVIHIGYQHAEGENIFTFQDQGVGMPDDVVENVFRLDTPHPKTIGTFQEKGSGLGLIICKTLTDRLNGSISMESIKNKGVKIIIRVPEMQGLPEHENMIINN